jgi:hypothetical protein
VDEWRNISRKRLSFASDAMVEMRGAPWQVYIKLCPELPGKPDIAAPLGHIPLGPGAENELRRPGELPTPPPPPPPMFMFMFELMPMPMLSILDPPTFDRLLFHPC